MQFSILRCRRNRCTFIWVNYKWIWHWNCKHIGTCCCTMFLFTTYAVIYFFLISCFYFFWFWIKLDSVFFYIFSNCNFTIHTFFTFKKICIKFSIFRSCIRFIIYQFNWIASHKYWNFNWLRTIYYNVSIWWSKIFPFFWKSFHTTYHEVWTVFRVQIKFCCLYSIWIESGFKFFFYIVYVSNSASRVFESICSI